MPLIAVNLRCILHRVVDLATVGGRAWWDSLGAIEVDVLEAWVDHSTGKRSPFHDRCMICKKYVSSRHAQPCFPVQFGNM